MRRRLFTVLAVFAVGISASSGLWAADPKVAKPADAAAKTSTGTFTIDGKTYKLPHVVVYTTKVFDEDGIAVFFCEKEIPIEKLKAALVKGKGSDDSFNLFEPQVKVTFNKKGEPSYSNAWADNSSISVSGGGLKGQLVVKDNRATGQATMETGDTPESKKSFDLRFDAPLLTVAIPKAEPEPEAKPDDSDKPKSKSRRAKKKEAEKKEAEKAKAAEGTANVYDLPLPKDATDVEYKKLVEQFGYKSPSSVSKVTEFLIEKLEADGWKSDDSDLITPISVILKREKGDASLTIFVKNEASGSKVTIMSEGLSWEEKKKADVDPKKEKE
ncbi:MAG: hypothetical protein V4719_07985 [Planctomycetota bacterium]